MDFSWHALSDYREADMNMMRCKMCNARVYRACGVSDARRSCSQNGRTGTRRTCGLALGVDRRLLSSSLFVALGTRAREPACVVSRRLGLGPVPSPVSHVKQSDKVLASKITCLGSCRHHHFIHRISSLGLVAQMRHASWLTHGTWLKPEDPEPQIYRAPTVDNTAKWRGLAHVGGGSSSSIKTQERPP